MNNIWHIIIFVTILQMIPMLVMVWIGVVAAAGLLKKKKPAPPLISDDPTRFGIIICAHNEGNAIRSLLESIASQEYDMENIRVFLLADRCTDNTADIGREYEFVQVFERNSDNISTRGKADVIRWGLERIFKADPENKINAYAIIDADNVLRPDFLAQMDRKLREGNLIVQGNRLGGQPYRSVITKWYTIYWACYTTFFSYAREKVGLSALLTGTGFAVNADLLRKEGWHTDTITEDVEFTIQNVLKGRRAAFCIDAVCYDEQPYKAGVMFSQLARWCTGGYQVLRENIRGLMDKHSPARGIQRFDIIMLLLMGPCSWISAIISCVNGAIMIWNLPLFYFMPFVFATAFGTVCVYIGAAITLKYNYISRRKIGLLAIITFPLFMYAYMLCSIKACFLPSKTWAKIDHASLDISQN